MTREQYGQIEAYLAQTLTDSAHDREHVYRVLHVALDIAATEPGVDRDVLIAACLLHDVGRPAQTADPTLCHALVGGEKAERFLLCAGWPAAFAARVRACVETHRYRADRPPQTTEAKILFDADKIDATGTLGIARTLIYKGQHDQPLYSVRSDGSVSDGDGDDTPSFFHEYRFKLERLYDRFHTARGRQIAQARRAAAAAFYQAMLHEVADCREAGQGLLAGWLD